MSSFGSKRKAKVIKVADDNDPAEQAPDTSSSDTQKDGKYSLTFSKITADGK
jgi:hypothetical protein